MLYKFKSKDYGDVIMLALNGRRVLEIIGKDAGPQGILLPEQMPAAIEALQAAIVEEERAEKEAGVVQGNGPGLRQRALPFIELLQRNHRAGHEVLWGV